MGERISPGPSWRQPSCTRSAVANWRPPHGLNPTTACPAAATRACQRHDELKHTHTAALTHMHATTDCCLRATSSITTSQTHHQPPHLTKIRLQPANPPTLARSNPSQAHTPGTTPLALQPSHTDPRTSHSPPPQTSPRHPHHATTGTNRTNPRRGHQPYPQPQRIHPTTTTTAAPLPHQTTGM